MKEYVTAYCDLVEERVNQYENATVELEQKVDFSKWVPEGFGTSDVVVLSDKTIEIIDLKYGKGVPVDAYLNPQLMLYALGAVDKYDIIYEFETVRMTIIQPRLDNISTFEIEKKNYYTGLIITWRLEQCRLGKVQENGRLQTTL